MFHFTHEIALLNRQDRLAEFSPFGVVHWIWLDVRGSENKAWNGRMEGWKIEGLEFGVPSVFCLLSSVFYLKDAPFYILGAPCNSRSTTSAARCPIPVLLSDSVTRSI